MRNIEIGSDTEIFQITSAGTAVMYLLPPTATADLPGFAAVPTGTLVYDVTTKKLNFSDGAAWRVCTST